MDGFTSREAARISGVPFFTVDYWDRSKFLKPSIARSAGRGRGRGRLSTVLDASRYVFVGEKVELVADFPALSEILRTKTRTFGFLLDLSEIQRGVAQRALKVRSPRAPAGSRLAHD